MIDMSAMLDRLAEWVEFARRYWSLGSGPAPAWTAAIAFVAGVVLAMWGARLLRAAYVIGFIVAGAAIGIRVARSYEVELLIGLVIGGGVLGLVGYVFYRWWIGLTAGLVAAAIVVSVGAPWTLRQAESFADTLLQQATGQRVFTAAAAAGSGQTAAPSGQPTAAGPADPGGPAIDWSAVATALRPADGQAQTRPSPLTCLAALARTLWASVPADVRNIGFLAGLAGLLALALGVILPRFTTIVGTSVVGVLAIAAAAAYLISAKAPDLWRSIQAQPAWFYGPLGLLLVVSLAFQARRGKLRQIAPAAPATPAAG